MYIELGHRQNISRHLLVILHLNFFEQNNTADSVETLSDEGCSRYVLFLCIGIQGKANKRTRRLFLKKRKEYDVKSLVHLRCTRSQFTSNIIALLEVNIDQEERCEEAEIYAVPAQPKA